MLKPQNKVYSCPVFGYSLDEDSGLLVENDKEQQVIAAIQQLRRDGASYRVIVKTLN